MKIGIITFHFPYNCGAVLQCAALQKCLKNQGHEVCVINYRPWYHQNRYTPLKNPFYYAKKRFQDRSDQKSLIYRFLRGGVGFARVIYSWRHFRAVYARHRKFEGFMERNLNQTRIYRSLRQLQASPPGCDLYISGSDQLWNPYLTEGKFDTAYFLDFGKESTHRISYAVGADFSHAPQSLAQLPKLLRPFHAISLRERKAYNEVREAVSEETEISIDLDPTFLIEQQDYESMICPHSLENEPFILTYTMPDPSQHQIYSAANLLSEKLGIKVIDVSGNPDRVHKKIKDNRTCGPDEFLWYMKNARYVLTNSFHGTAFSVIYRKNFMVIPHLKTGNRAVELLEKLALQTRWESTGIDAAEKALQPVDYSETQQVLDDYRRQSLDYLKRNLAVK